MSDINPNFVLNHAPTMEAEEAESNNCANHLLDSISISSIPKTAKVQMALKVLLLNARREGFTAGVKSTLQRLAEVDINSPVLDISDSK